MKRKFKTKRRNKVSIIKLISILLIIYASYNIFYLLIYNSYLKKLSNKEIITHIIENTKNYKSNNKLIEKYKDPHNIIKNNFSLQPSASITVEKEIDKSPLVYIYCTHETESYQDPYLEIYNIKPTIKTMSYILQDYLNDYGIPTIVEEESITNILRNNNWSYKYSYEASKIAIEDTINKTPSLKLIIDLHRDSSSLEKTLLEVNNKKYAKILFVIGTEHENYESNYTIANSLNNLLNEEIPNITRGIIKKSGNGVNGIYNQNLSSKSILIELGGQYNEIEELNNSLKVLSKIILKYLEGDL